MAVFSKGIRYEKMPEQQKERDKYSKGDGKPWNLWWYIKLHQNMNI
jgi:hypothetical protein